MLESMAVIYVYRHDLRVITTELGQNAENPTRELLAGLFDVVSVRNYDPFAERHG